MNWKEESTKRGAVWLSGGLTAAIFSFMGKDPYQILAITAAVAGGMGLTRPDQPSDSTTENK